MVRVNIFWGEALMMPILSYQNLKITAKNERDAVVKYFRYYTHKLKCGIAIGTEGDWHLKSGVGKSYTGLRLGERLDKDYREGTTAMEKIVFTPRDYLRGMEYIEDHQNRFGQVLHIDEAGILANAKKWYSFINRAIADTVQTFRNLRAIANFISPSLMSVDKDIRIFMTHTLAPIKVYQGRLAVYLRVYRNYWDDMRGKCYKYKIKMYLSDYKKTVTFPYFYVKLPENKELLEEYEKVMVKYKKKVRQGIRELENVEKSYQELADEIIETGELIRESLKPKGKRVYAQEIADYYGITLTKARLVARRVNEILAKEVLKNAKEV